MIGAFLAEFFFVLQVGAVVHWSRGVTDCTRPNMILAQRDLRPRFTQPYTAN